MSKITSLKTVILSCLFTIFVTLEAACPPGWVTWQDSCYILLPQKMNWTDAFRACDRPGSAIAMPESQKEQDFIWREMKRQGTQNNPIEEGDFELWIGCKENRTNPRQLSCPGKKVDSDYTNWRKGCCRGSDDCVRMLSNSGDWDDCPCSATFFAACEMRVPHPVYCLTADDDGLFTSRCLLNHDIKNLTAKGVVGCGQACWAEPRCHSFNLWQQGKICQLNNASRLEAGVADFKNIEGCSFFEL
ncbi:snaclec mucrocetin subunit beta-like [Asterias rubens]|uniref:snaclec mucrocetin subunit beta-like n=1 Tax=Asterias rubens TaxID=7604 RepID=UPI0014558435|nr:snaclec mucrocetin subunit beta-like [Asterias rubens]